MPDRSLIERIARHLARQEPDGWQSLIPDAASLLAIMKEPDRAMREAGSGETWGMMIDAALQQRWELAPGSDAEYDQGGADEEGETPLHREAITRDRADWVHIQDEQE